MSGRSDPWDADYRHRGRLWGGSVPGPGSFAGSGRVLELGCGDGRTVAALARAGTDVVGTDRSPGAALLCRQACPEPEKAGVVVADAQQNPFRSGSFDRIIASHIVGHLDRAGRARLAGEVYRLLAPGGRLHFRDFSVSDFRYGNGEQAGEATFLRKNGIATHYFTEDEVRALFAGLSSLSSREHRWELRVRGTVYPRAEIVAVFERPSSRVTATNPM